MRGQRKYDFHVGNKTFTDGTHVMAILNVTPDSFLREADTLTTRLKPPKSF